MANLEVASRGSSSLERPERTQLYALRPPGRRPVSAGRGRLERLERLLSVSADIKELFDNLVVAGVIQSEADFCRKGERGLVSAAHQAGLLGRPRTPGMNSGFFFRIPGGGEAALSAREHSMLLKCRLSNIFGPVSADEEVQHKVAAEAGASPLGQPEQRRSRKGKTALAATPTNLELLSELDPKLERSSALEALSAVRKIPLELPAGGSYQLEFKNNTLHIFETTTGISSFSCPSAAISVVGEHCLALRINTSVGELAAILHTQQAEPDPKALLASDLPIRHLLEEYEALTAGSQSNPAEKTRAIELLNEIRNYYSKK